MIIIIYNYIAQYPVNTACSTRLMSRGDGGGGGLLLVDCGHGQIIVAKYCLNSRSMSTQRNLHLTTIATLTILWRRFFNWTAGIYV